MILSAKFRKLFKCSLQGRRNAKSMREYNKFKYKSLYPSSLCFSKDEYTKSGICLKNKYISKAYYIREPAHMYQVWPLPLHSQSPIVSNKSGGIRNS